MSSKGTRKSQVAAISEEKEKRTDSPVKEMKKKMAANAEKEKQVVDKTDKNEKSDKPSEKTDKGADKNEKTDKSAPTPDKNTQKTDKTAQKVDKTEKTDKTAQKTDKPAQKPDKTDKDKKLDKSIEKSDKVEKKVEKVTEKKTEKPAEKKQDQAEKKEEGKGEANGKDAPASQVKTNGKASNGDTVSDGSSDEDLALVIDDQDESFPELAYDDDEDEEVDAQARSFTRRSQVKATKTPETPRPASVKEDDSKEKAKLKEDPLATDRKLRSADSPKPEAKKKAHDSPKKDTAHLADDNNDDKQHKKLEVDVLIELSTSSSESETRAPRTRARVSPYTRPARLDHTTTSVTANYTGNNTTMETDIDITESSSIIEESLDDSYLRGLRSIRGRASYKLLKDMPPVTRPVRSVDTSLTLSEAARPTGTVVGRKRKPDADDNEPEQAVEAGEEAATLLHAHTKRMRLFDRMAVPFRGFRAREIVGINTDLPQSAPFAPTFDPESLKTGEPTAVPLPAAPPHDRDSSRCTIM